MLRKALLATIAPLAIALPLSVASAQTARRQPAPAPTLGERLSSFGRELFGDPDGGVVGDPFAPPSEARRMRAPERRAPERVAANPKKPSREPAPAATRNLPPYDSTPPLDTTASNRRRHVDDEGRVASEPESTAAIPRRESRADFTPAMPREESPTTVTTRRRTYQPPEQSRYAAQPRAAQLAHSHAPQGAPNRTRANEQAEAQMPPSAHRSSEMQTARPRSHGNAGTVPQIVRNRHVEGPRAGSVAGVPAAMNDEPAPRMVRSPQPVEDESYLADQADDLRAVVVETATPPADERHAEQKLAPEGREADFVAEEQSTASGAMLGEEESDAEMERDTVATDIGAEGRTLSERLAAARSFAAPKPVLRDPAKKKPPRASNPVAPIAPDPDAAEAKVAAKPTTIDEMTASDTAEEVAEPAADVDESQALVGIPNKVTHSQPEDAPQVALPEAAPEVEAANNVEPSQVAARDRSPMAANVARNSTAFESTRQSQAAPSDESVLLTKKSPLLSVETIGPRNIKVGLPARYRVVVENSGQIAAEGVSVNVALPEWADVVGANASTGTARSFENATRGVEWRVGRIDPGNRQQLALEITARRSEPLALDVRWSLAPIASQTSVVVEEPKLEMRLDGPDEVNYGEIERFVLEVSNPGNGDAELVVVRLVPANPGEEVIQQSIGTIAAGETRSVDLELSAHKSGTFWIKAEAEGQGDLRASVAAEVLVRRAALAVAIEGPPFQYAGTEATYRVRLTNTGNAAARNVELRALLPAEAEQVSSTETARVEMTGGRIVWGLAGLAAGEEREFEFCCKFVEPGTIRPQVVCTAADELTASDGTETTIEALADLSLEIHDPRGPVRVGEKARYEVRIKNRGTSAAHDIDVAAFFAEGVEPVEANGVEHRLAEGQVLFDKIASLDAGEELVLTISAEAASSGNHAFRVELTCPELETKLAGEESTHFYDPRRGQSADAVPAGNRESSAEPMPAEEVESPTAEAETEVPAQP